MQSAEISFFIRAVAGCRLLDHKRNEDIAEELGLTGRAHYKVLSNILLSHWKEYFKCESKMEDRTKYFDRCVGACTEPIP
jgi:hypothetical protein